VWTAMAVLFRGGRAVFNAMGRSAREPWRKITRQSPSYRTIAPPGPSGPAMLARKPSGGISSITFHRRAVQSADGAASDPADAHPRLSELARGPTRALTRTSVLLKGLASMPPPAAWAADRSGVGPASMAGQPW
jgi:hypothetical protein